METKKGGNKSQGDKDDNVRLQQLTPHRLTLESAGFMFILAVDAFGAGPRPIEPAKGW